MGDEARGHLALVVAAFLFGTTFVVVQEGIADLSPFAFLALRFAVAALVLVPFAPITGVSWPAALCSVLLFTGYALQTVGLQYTTTSNSAFITGLFMVFTPILSAAVLRRPPSRGVAAGVAIATGGLFLLTGASPALGRGDALTLGCAVAFAAHIVAQARFATRFPLVPFTRDQMAVVAVLSALFVPFAGIGEVTVGALAGCAFTGVAVGGVSFSLMVYGQRRVGPARSGLLLGLEPVFAAVIGWMTGERLRAVGYAGAAVILAGVVVSELPRRAPTRARD